MLLKKIRVTVSVVLCVLITVYFLDFSGLLPEKFSILTDIQLIPALLASNAVVLFVLIVLTLLFGRIYCSSVCPMGIYQDAVAWSSRRFFKKKKYTYSRAKTALRCSILGTAIVAFFLGFSFLIGLLDPYGAYGRMATHLFRPAYAVGNNLIESLFASLGDYRFYKVGIYGFGLLSTAVAFANLLGIGFLAWRNGRTYCNTICPVGTLLGFMSRFSLFRIQFVDDKCNRCGLCTMNCKSSCIDSKNKQIDATRCVTCFNCIDSCKRDAIRYAFARSAKKNVVHSLSLYTCGKEIPDESKRRFLSATLVTGLAAAKLLAENRAKKFPHKGKPKRQTPIALPGSLNFERFRKRCTSCHLCVSKCPSQVIKPAFLEYGVEGMMQPKLYFDRGFCNYDCTVCSDICPTDALVKLSKQEKHHTQIGRVNFIVENCIVYCDETSCGACSEHCPTQAVHMVPYKDSLTIPETDPDICVGCGGCEYVCPAIPYKAIYVEGISTHNIIEIEQEKPEEVQIDEFGF